MKHSMVWNQRLDTWEYLVAQLTHKFQSMRHWNWMIKLIPPPKDCKVINSKWFFKCKQGENGLIEHYKARLVAQDYTQRPGIDYDETFSPVVHFESVPVVVALAVHENIKLHQMDVKTAFLNGELNEESSWSNQKDLWERAKKTWYVVWKRVFMV